MAHPHGETPHTASMPEAHLHRPTFLYQLKVGEAAWCEPDALVVDSRRACYLNIGAECFPATHPAFAHREEPFHIGHLSRERLYGKEDAQLTYRWTMRVVRRGLADWLVDVTLCIPGHKWRPLDDPQQLQLSGEAARARPTRYFITPVAELILHKET